MLALFVTVYWTSNASCIWQTSLNCNYARVSSAWRKWRESLSFIIRHCIQHARTCKYCVWKLFLVWCCCVLVCPAERWGENCENICRCVECHNVRGCTSCVGIYDGWTGPNCDEDIDECENVVLNCGPNSDCQNINGSYICECHSWYQRFSDRCVCKCWTHEHT